MSDDLYDFAIQKASISGYFARDYELKLKWSPHYVKEFPKALRGVQLTWEKCKFLRNSKDLIPEKHGVYCFAITLGEPFPEKIHLPLYIGKAAPGFLSERFNSYLIERENVKGRKKIVLMLNRYRNELFFWWTELPRIHVDTVEEHLLMCCHPPCNDVVYNREKLWSKAFDK